MKNLIIYVFLFATVISSANGNTTNITEQQSYYENLVKLEEKSLPTKWPSIYDAHVLTNITTALSLNNPEINQSLINYLHIRVLRYFKNVPFSPPDKVQLEKLKNIPGLRSFLFKELELSPNQKLFFIISIFYGDERDVRNKLIVLGEESDSNLICLINAFLCADIYIEKIDKLILKAISNEDINVALVAATYLKRFPLSESLPYLIKNYTRTDLNVRLQSVTNAPPNIQDISRMLFGMAILAYDTDEILVFEKKIRILDKKTSLGKMAKSNHEAILRKLDR